MRKVSQLALCEKFLEKRLADGPVPSADIHAEAEAKGLSKTALHRAARDLDIVSVSVPGEFGLTTTWYLSSQLSPEQEEAATGW